MSSSAGPVRSDELPPLVWRTSSFSTGNGGSCVEVAPFADGTGRVAVRHSKLPDGTAIVYTSGEWEAFLAGAKNGEFDF